MHVDERNVNVPSSASTVLGVVRQALPSRNRLGEALDCILPSFRECREEPSSSWIREYPVCDLLIANRRSCLRHRTSPFSSIEVKTAPNHADTSTKGRSQTLSTTKHATATTANRLHSRPLESLPAQNGLER